MGFTLKAVTSKYEKQNVMLHIQKFQVSNFKNMKKLEASSMKKVSAILLHPKQL